MKHTIIRSVSGALCTLLLAGAIAGCSTSSTSSKRSAGSRALVNGKPKEIITRVIQWCVRHRCEVLNHGNSYMAARITEYRFMDGEFVFEGNCGVHSLYYPKETLNDPRIKVSVDSATGQAETSIVSVVLSARSEFGDCRSSGVVEQSLFEYLGAMPLLDQ